MMQPYKDERPFMIVCGVIFVYILIAGFFVSLYLLHRLSPTILIILLLLWTIIYIPRLRIIYEIKNSDKLKVSTDCFIINGSEIKFSGIKNFGVREHKPQIVFFINNRMYIYQKADFCLDTTQGKIEFTIIGSEKIALVQEFLKKILKPNVKF